MKSKKVTLGLLIFYIMALVWVVLFKFQFSLGQLDHFRSVNLIPFAGSVIVNGKRKLQVQVGHLHGRN